MVRDESYRTNQRKSCEEGAYPSTHSVIDSEGKGDLLLSVFDIVFNKDLFKVFVAFTFTQFINKGIFIK